MCRVHWEGASQRVRKSIRIADTELHSRVELKTFMCMCVCVWEGGGGFKLENSVSYSVCLSDI